VFDTEQIDSATIVIRMGRVLDNNNAHEVMQVVDAAIKDGHRFVVCDMTGLEFLSSAGVGSLISSLSVLRSNGGSLTLFGLSEKILHVLEVLDLKDYIPMETNLEAAVARCKSQAKPEGSTQG